MNVVVIEKNRLKLTLEANRRQHKAEYKVARDAYRKSVAEWMKEQIKKIKAKEDFEIWYQDEPEPSDHTEDYDSILEMLDFHIEPEISLTQQEFRQYIQDNWSWQQQFKASATYYNTKAKVGTER